LRRALAVALACAAVGITSCSSTMSARPGAPTALTVDGLQSPIGLGVSDVAFAWHVVDARRGAVESAYRLTVSRVKVSGSHPTPTSTIWDSGRVKSSATAFVPYGGPALASDSVYQWRVQTWDGFGKASARSAPASFETGLRDQDWKADWIRRPADPKTEPDQYTYARKQVTLDASPIVRARVYVSGDQQYELYVNGARAGKGEAYSYPDTQYYETDDVTKVLHAGAANAFGLLDTWDGPTKGHPAGEPGVIAQISVTHRNGTVESIVTDGSWRVRKGAWLPGTQRDLEGDLVDYTENIDGPAFPVGWDQPGFSDQSWAPATVIGPAGTAPWTHLVSVRTRIVEEPVRAVMVTRLASGAVVADFGKVYAALPTVTFHHGVAGRTITMHAGYLLDEPGGQVSVTHGTQHTNMSYSYVERGGGTEQFHPFDYLGFRYLQIDNPGETLVPGDVVALARHTAVPNETAATFSSPNPTINAIFQLGSHSALYTAQEQFIDTPTREKGSWLWDGFNSSETTMAAFGEQNLTRKSLTEFAQSQSRYWPNGAVNKIYPTGLGALDINEYTEIYPEWVWQYWMETGDRTLIKAVYPVLVKLAGYIEHSVDPATHLVTNLPATSIYYDFPTVTRLNILGVDVFRRTADIAHALGRPASEISVQRDRATALTDAINTKFRRVDLGYADGLDANGTQVPVSSQTTNACAVVYGIVPGNDVTPIDEVIARQGMSAVPRTASEVLDALAIGGRDDDLIRILTDKKIDGWANILSQGGTFTWEVWKPSDIIGDSMSHGWGANVLVSIRHDLLGVTPKAPGYSTFTVQPPRRGLASARGTVPTPFGPISVAWRHATTSDKTFALDVTVPPDTVAEVWVAMAKGTRVTDGGHPLILRPGVLGIDLLPRGVAGYALITLGAGTYHLRSVTPAA
jgi:alpha-L-rhamnosidase